MAPGSILPRGRRASSASLCQNTAGRSPAVDSAKTTDGRRQRVTAVSGGSGGEETNHPAIPHPRSTASERTRRDLELVAGDGRVDALEQRARHWLALVRAAVDARKVVQRHLLLVLQQWSSNGGGGWGGGGGCGGSAGGRGRRRYRLRGGQEQSETVVPPIRPASPRPRPGPTPTPSRHPRAASRTPAPPHPRTHLGVVQVCVEHDDREGENVGGVAGAQAHRRHLLKVAPPKNLRHSGAGARGRGWWQVGRGDDRCSERTAGGGGG